eukprot:GHVR01076522.1.p1 GENE.GHVR01076522.1~~GHVR01076522.1.p1  ORF type:complete len:188 (+),score=23.55 GHVR01076522.1:340-903(+)
MCFYVTFSCFTDAFFYFRLCFSCIATPMVGKRAAGLSVAKKKEAIETLRSQAFERRFGFEDTNQKSGSSGDIAAVSSAEVSSATAGHCPKPQSDSASKVESANTDQNCGIESGVAMNGLHNFKRPSRLTVNLAVIEEDEEGIFEFPLEIEKAEHPLLAYPIETAETPPPNTFKSSSAIDRRRLMNIL